MAELAPRPDVPAQVRKLPEPRAAQGPSGELRPDAVASPEALPELVLDAVASPLPRMPARPAVVEPLRPDRFSVTFTASAVLREKLERLQALMPDADLAGIIEAAVTEKLERLEARRFAKTKTPRKSLAETDTTPSTRYLPAALRRAVYERDGGRCRYVDSKGKRCTARRRLEFHHRQSSRWMSELLLSVFRQSVSGRERRKDHPANCVQTQLRHRKLPELVLDAVASPLPRMIRTPSP